jgi:DNA-binding IclR family transcriptional regulator
VRCIGVPILNGATPALAAISLSGTTSQISGATVHSFVDELKAKADAISRSNKLVEHR